MKPHSSIWVVRTWCGVHTVPILRCFDNPEGQNNGHLHSERGPRVYELANGLRLGTAMLSQDLSGVWVIIRKCLSIGSDSD
jgi:hypothetical protein